MRLVLASASPRRSELLRQAGHDPLVLPADVPEPRLEGESPETMVGRLAEVKARAVVPALARDSGPYLVLGADTAVVLDGRVLGKPGDPAEARSMLRSLREREHEVLTGVFLLRTDDGRGTTGVGRTRVNFSTYDDEWIESYVAGGEPMDKAGAYAIQGGAASVVTGIEGSWSNVVGLPLECLPAWLDRIGLAFDRLA
jgi:septum formation protein